MLNFILMVFRQATQEMAQTVKQQLQTVKTQHKNDIDSLRKQVSDSKKEAQRYQTLVSSQRSCEQTERLVSYLKMTLTL